MPYVKQAYFVRMFPEDFESLKRLLMILHVEGSNGLSDEAIRLWAELNKYDKAPLLPAVEMYEPGEEFPYQDFLEV